MLEVKDFEVRYGSTAVIRGISLQIAPGEMLAIIGESGAGKTSLGLGLMRLGEGSVSGQVRLQGTDLLSLSEREMEQARWSRIAMAFQNVNNSFNPVYRLIDQVAEPMVAHRLYGQSEARERALALLRMLGLPEVKATAYPHQVSGGERQRALIAMALANDPEVLVLDEPLAGLDAPSRIEMIGRLREVADSRIVLLFSHDLDTVARLSPRTAVLYGGLIVEAGPTDEVLSDPRHPYTRGLVRAYPNMTTVKDLQGIPGRMTRPDAGCPFYPRCTQALDSCAKETPQLMDHDGRQLACHRGGVITLLATKRLSVSFGSFQVVRSVDLDIKAGETLALVGESGSGKTTLARTIMGLQEPSEGDVFLEGVRLQDRGRNFYRQVQMVFQNPAEAISHRLTVMETVREPLDVQKVGDPKERTEKVLAALHDVLLPTDLAFLGRYPHQLSGGETQRVAIARALAMGPRLIIADEPTAFLDASVQAKILKLLLDLQEQRGLSLLFITHDMAIARKVSDRIAVMQRGQIVESGPAHRLVAMPTHDHTRSLLDASASLDAGGGYVVI